MDIQSNVRLVSIQMSGGETLYHIIIPTFITDPSILQASTGRDKQWAIAGTNVRVLESKGNTLKAAFPELVQFTPN